MRWPLSEPDWCQVAELNLKSPQVSDSDFPGLYYFPHFYRWNARFVQVFCFSVTVKQTALKLSGLKLCSQFSGPGTWHMEDSTGVCSDRPQPGGRQGSMGPCVWASVLVVSGFSSSPNRPAGAARHQTPPSLTKCVTWDGSAATAGVSGHHSPQAIPPMVSWASLQPVRHETLASPRGAVMRGRKRELLGPRNQSSITSAISYRSTQPEIAPNQIQRGKSHRTTAGL